MPPNRLVADRCLQPGHADNGCPAGTLGLADGTCQPAGVPPELCAEGFVHDGDAACNPILPPEPCPKGQMALFGERTCHAVMPCGAGRWGAIPVDATTVYVDASYSGGDSDGSEARPWTTITQALGVAAAGVLIAVAQGSYLEDVVVQKRARLWGVCPERVDLRGTDAASAAVSFGPSSSGSELGGVAVTGSAMGVHVSGAEDVLIDRVWVHDLPDDGLHIENSSTAAAATLRDSLVELNGDLGVFVAGSRVELDGVVVRGTLPQPSDQLWGRGLQIEPDPITEAPSTALLAHSIVEQNHDVGVYVSSSEATIEGVVVRGTLPRANGEVGGWGIAITTSTLSTEPANARVSSSLIDQNQHAGMMVFGSQATLEGIVVRNTLPQAVDQQSGLGIGIASDPSGAMTSALVTSSLVEHNHETGVLVIASQATLEGVLVRDTRPQASDQNGGTGINIQGDITTGVPSSAVVEGSVVEHNHGVGVVVIGSQATLEGALVRATQPRASDQFFGKGINIQLDVDTGVRSNALVSGSLIEQNHSTGVSVIGSDATLHASLVSDTLPRIADGAFGDGVNAMSWNLQGSAYVTSALVIESRIEKNTRAGLGNFGAVVALERSALACNSIDLNGERLFEFPHHFEDRGENRCGCPDATSACKATSSGLAPPEAVTEAP